MSQLNKNIRNMLIIIILFTAICIGITYLAITSKIKDKNSIKTIYEESKTTEKNAIFEHKKITQEAFEYGLKSFDEKYWLNGLNVKQNYIQKYKIKDKTSTSDEEYKLNIYYSEIDGLKNKGLQDEINEKLKTKIDNLYSDEEINDPNLDYISIDCYNMANFSNVLSFSLSKSVFYKDNNSSYKSYGINIDLNTGNEIKFKELFTSNAPIKNIITSSAYKALAIEYGYENSSEECDMSKIDYSDIEDRIFKILNYYNSGKEFEFYFTSKNIFINILDNNISINMSDYLNQIAIYKRFDLGNDLYTGKYKVDDQLYVFLHYNPILYNKYIFEKVSDNILLRIRVFEYDDIFKDRIEKILKNIENNTEDYKKEDKAFFIDYNINNWYDEKILDEAEIYVNETVYKTSKSYFNSKFYEYIITTMQNHEEEEIYLEDDDKNIQIENNYYKDIYNSQTKKFTREKDDEINNEITDLDITDDIKNSETSDSKINSDKKNSEISDSKIIVIDPGHQRYGNNEKEPIGPGAEETKAKVTTGATGISTGQLESELTLKVSLLLQSKLEKLGYQVIMTRITNDVDISNRERAEVANSVKADAFIRIHANSAEDQTAKGVLTMCQTENNIYNGEIADKSYNLSQFIVDNISIETGAKNRSVTKTDNMSGINWCKVPTTIVEMGFLSNEEEDKLLATDEYQNKVVDGIVEGLKLFFDE